MKLSVQNGGHFSVPENQNKERNKEEIIRSVIKKIKTRFLNFCFDILTQKSN
jgi:hypothetical protein